jgi:hypothetical protein
MALSTDADALLKRLQSLSFSSKPSSASPLNTAFRDSLRDFAESHDYAYAVRPNSFN